MRKDDIIPRKIEADECSGITTHRHIKRDWHVCPRCMKPRVNRWFRKCDNCGGILLWYGDEQWMDYCLARGIDFYCWYKSIFNLEGYYHSSYFIGQFPKCKASDF